MDPPPLFRREYMYRNTFYSPGFLPRDLLPPPPPPPLLPPPYIHLPPPIPLLPPRHDSHLLFRSGFPFSPRHHHIPEISRDLELGPPNRLLFDSFLPSLKPLPQNAIFPVSIRRNYPHRNPRSEFEIPIRGCSDKFVHGSFGSRDENLRGDVREYNSMVSGMEQGYRCNNFWESNSEGRELFKKRKYEASRCEYGIQGNCNMMPFERDYDGRRGECATNADCDLTGRSKKNESRWGYGVEALSSQLDNSGKELLDDRLGWGRLNVRLGGVFSEREFSRSKKMKRGQKKSALRRIRSRKSCSGFTRSHIISENTSMSRFKSKGKMDFKCMETRVENKREEQSPVSLSISFKSNSLVAKAVVVPSSPTIMEGKNLSPENRKTGDAHCVVDLPLTNSAKDLVRTEHMLDSRSGLQGDCMELTEKFNVSGTVKSIAYNTSDFVDHCEENAPEKNLCLQGLNDIRSRRRLKQRLRKKKIGINHVLGGKRLRVPMGSYEVKYTIAAGASDEPKTNCTLSKTNTSSALIDSAPDAFLLPSFQSIVSEKVGIDGDSNEPIISNSKRKRNSFKLLSPLHVVGDASSECSGNSGREVSANKDNYCASYVESSNVTDMVPPSESLLGNENTGHGDNFGFSHNGDSFNICQHNMDSLLTAATNSIMETTNRSSTLRTHTVYNMKEQPFCDGNSLLENSYLGWPSGFPVSVDGEHISDRLRPMQTGIFEVCEDKRIPEDKESYTSSVSDVALLNKIDNVVSDMRSADANLKQNFPNQVTDREVDVEKTRIFDDAAVAYCSNTDLGVVNPNSHPEDPKEIVFELGASYLNTTFNNEDGNLSHKIISTEGSPEAINLVKTYSCTAYSLDSKSERRARGSQRDNSTSDNNMLSDTGSSIDAQFETRLSKDPSCTEKVDCLGEMENCEVVFRLKKGPFGDEDSPQNDIDISAVSSFCGNRNKRKVISSGITPSHPSENDLIGNSLTNECIKLDHMSPRPPERRVNAKEGTPLATYIDLLDGENFSLTCVDDMLVDDDKPNLRNNVSFSNTCTLADGSGFCDTKSGDVSGSDTPSCVSSPEDFLLYSDFTLPRDINSSSSHVENEVIYGRHDAFNAKPVSGISCPSSSAKSTEDATFNHAQMNANTSLSPSLPQNMCNVVQKFSLVCGKLSLGKRTLTHSVPKAFPGNHAPSFNKSRIFPSTHSTKSRTWHRTSNSSAPVAVPKLPHPSLPHSHGKETTDFQNSYIRHGNKLVRKPSSSGVASKSSIYQLSHCGGILKEGQTFDIKVDTPSVSGIGLVNTYARTESPSLNHVGKSLSSESGHQGKPLGLTNSLKNECSIDTLGTFEETVNASSSIKCHIDSGNNSALGKETSGKKLTYVKRRSNQLVAASDPDDSSASCHDKLKASFSDGYYKKRKNQLIRVPSESHVKEEDGPMNTNLNKFKSQTKFPRISSKRQPSKGYDKTFKSSKISTVWKLNDSQLSNKDTNTLGRGPKKLSPYLFPLKRSTYRRTSPSLVPRPNDSSHIRQKLMLSRKRGAIYTRSTHGYSLRMSKVLSVGGSSLKWSKSIEKNSKKANEEATRAVAAAGKRKKEENGVIPVVSKRGNHVSRMSGERIYKMDPTRRTFHRITAEEESSPSSTIISQKNSMRSYVPKRLLIGNDEYVRFGNGNQLVRDPKRRTRVLASEKVRWSLRTARMRLARKRKYCQFFTRFGKCNKSDGKCPYIHDTSKIAVCTKFLNDSCPDPDCKLTHKIIPERMSDCSYFLKGSCSNEKCPYRHGNVNPNSSICKKFLRGYCPDGNECRKKHTYVCPAFESTGICPQGFMCKLHHPKMKNEKKPTMEQKNVRGRYFDGVVMETDDYPSIKGERHSAKKKGDVAHEEGKYPDYISLDISDEEVE